jgi:CHAD domain-containing protein
MAQIGETLPKMRARRIRVGTTWQAIDTFLPSRYRYFWTDPMVVFEFFRLCLTVTESAAAEGLSAMVASRWRAVRRQVRRSGSYPSSVQLHRVRIKAKQLRYTAEAAAPVVGRPARKTATAAKRVQTVLGHHHDAVAEEEWLRTALTGDASIACAASVCLEAGRLVAGAQQCQRAARRDWSRAWPELRDPKHRHRLSH